MSNDPLAGNVMEEIDFLPEQFRRQHVERQFQPWRILAVCVAAALVIGATATQSRQKARLESELAALEAAYRQAQSQQSQLAAMQARLQQHRAAAELITYLKFPWPRSRLLAALAVGAPEEVAFSEIHIQSRADQGTRMLERRSRAEKSRTSEQAAKLPPAAQDLTELREQWDQAQCLVVIAGTTTDSMALHRYLADLAEHPLFEDVELDSMETFEAGQQSAMQFQATLKVRPGYGQPLGPQGPLSAEAATDGPAPEPNTDSPDVDVQSVDQASSTQVGPVGRAAALASAALTRDERRLP